MNLGWFIQDDSARNFSGFSAETLVLSQEPLNLGENKCFVTLSEPVIAWKTLKVFIVNGKIWVLKQTLAFWKTCVGYDELDSFSKHKDFSEKMMVILMWYSLIKCYQDLEDLHSSMNKYFPNGQCMTLQSLIWIKDPFKVWNGSMNFNKAEYQGFINIVSGSTLQLTIKNYNFLSFGIVVKKNVHNYLKKQLKASPFLNMCLNEAGFSLIRGYYTEWNRVGRDVVDGWAFISAGGWLSDPPTVFGWMCTHYCQNWVSLKRSQRYGFLGECPNFKMLAITQIYNEYCEGQAEYVGDLLAAFERISLLFKKTPTADKRAWRVARHDDTSLWYGPWGYIGEQTFPVALLIIRFQYSLLDGHD